jgi:Carboxypeptidase regulatory-like domain
MTTRTLRRTRLIVLATLMLVCVGTLGACGAMSRPAAAKGTLTGDVVAGPTCPVEQANNPCPPRPVTGRQVTIEDADGHAVTTTMTDGRGHFGVDLAPGAYTVQVAIVPGAVGLRQVTPGQVTVAAGQTAYIKIELDTGIR